MSLASAARQFLHTTRSGVLSTLSAKFPGYPFGSVAPFVLDHGGQPIVLISTIAEHTKNIITNPKVSLFVFAGDEDLQASARLTLIGEAKQIDKEEANLRARYLRYFPQSAGYFETHDFNFYRLEIAQARYIAGFGKLGWVTGEELTGSELINTPTLLATQETAIIDHMNADHAHSLIAYSKHFHHMDVTYPQMLGIDSDGFDVRATIQPTAQTKILRFNFEQAIHDAQSARTALVAMSKAAQA
ncbi:MAG: DUF2470 domain-containing protein [Pseudomonadota bacterium]